MKNKIIAGIYKITLGDVLLELYINTKLEDLETSYKLSICDDGETIQLTENNAWFPIEGSQYGAYTVVEVNKYSDTLGQLLGNQIEHIDYGIGETLDDKLQVIYYVKISTTSNVFLFFNNGDNGAYAINLINDILEHDIFGYKWTSQPPRHLI